MLCHVRLSEHLLLRRSVVDPSLFGSLCLVADAREIDFAWPGLLAETRRQSPDGIALLLALRNSTS